ncbi:jg19755, partial [Pararge aegeria aegeria]
VQQVLGRLKAFKVAVHPRMRLVYQLLKRAMLEHARLSSDSLYNPSIYKREQDNLD